jgi:WD40 repeat protein
MAAVTGLSFCADGKRLLTAASQGESLGQSVPANIQLWEVASDLGECKVVNQFGFLQTEGDFVSLDFSDNGKFFLASDDVNTCVYSCEGDRLFELQGTLAKFRPNDNSFIVASSVYTKMPVFSLWDTEGVQLSSFISGLHNPVSALAFSPDGESIVAGGPSYGLAAWEVDSGDRVMFISDLFEETAPTILEDASEQANGTGVPRGRQ